MKKLLLLTATATIISCSKDEMETTLPVTTTPVVETAQVWGDWAPVFTDQTADFTQERSSDKNNTETRTISVSESVIATIEETERVLNSGDVNSDGDDVDLVSQDALLYTASNNLGSFETVSDFIMVEDIEHNFFTDNRGTWVTEFTELDLYVAIAVDKYGVLESFNANLDATCFTSVTPITTGEVEVYDHTLTTYGQITHRVDAYEFFSFDDAEYLESFGVTEIDIVASYESYQGDDQSLVAFAELVFASGTDVELYRISGNLGLHESIDTCDYGTITGKNAIQGKRTLDRSKLSLKRVASTSKYNWDIPQASSLVYARSNNGGGWNTPWWTAKYLKGHYIQWENNVYTNGQYPGKGSNQNNIGWYRGKTYHFAANRENPKGIMVTFHRGEDKLSIVQKGRADHLEFIVESYEYTTAISIDLIIQEHYTYAPERD